MPAEHNALIDGLPRVDRLRLLKHSEPVQLVLSQVLSEAHSPQSTVLFPVNAFVSHVQQTRGQPGVEVGMVGWEGMLGATLALGVSAAPMRSVVLGPGLAWRMDAARFESELRACEALRNRVRRYLFVTLVQLGCTSACHRFHPLEERLARWLLMRQDRARADEFEVTHAGLGLTLGVRREGVTLAASALQAAGVIRYRRGQVFIRDRQALENRACACYAADCSVYRAHLGGRCGTRS